MAVIYRFFHAMSYILTVLAVGLYQNQFVEFSRLPGGLSVILIYLLSM